jgi:hypothetical protein
MSRPVLKEGIEMGSWSLALAPVFVAGCVLTPPGLSSVGSVGGGPGTSAPASNLGGAAFQALVEAHCRKDPSKPRKEDRILFDTDFRFYDRCTHRYQCIQ